MGAPQRGGAGGRSDIRPPGDGEWKALSGRLVERWGSTVIVSRGRAREASALSALVAVRAGETLGLAVYEIVGRGCELVTLDAYTPREGTGTALLAAVAERAREAGCTRLWLVTSNDNLDALRFYQRRGMQIVAVHRGAIDQARALKPSIPLVGEHGIPVHDEVELELDPAAVSR